MTDPCCNTAFALCLLLAPACGPFVDTDLCASVKEGHLLPSEWGGEKTALHLLEEGGGWLDFQESSDDCLDQWMLVDPTIEVRGLGKSTVVPVTRSLPWTGAWDDSGGSSQDIPGQVELVFYCNVLVLTFDWAPELGPQRVVLNHSHGLTWKYCDHPA